MVIKGPITDRNNKSENEQEFMDNNENDELKQESTMPLQMQSNKEDENVNISPVMWDQSKLKFWIRCLGLNRNIKKCF